MKSDIDIKDDIYTFIKGSELENAVTGKLRKTRRPTNSKLEDIVISMVSNLNAQVQEAFVNVNIYVSDIIRDNQMEEDTIRLRELCDLSKTLLKVGRGGDFRFTIDTQRVLEVEGKDEHVINNRLLYRQCNE